MGAFSAQPRGASAPRPNNDERPHQATTSPRAASACERRGGSGPRPPRGGGGRGGDRGADAEKGAKGSARGARGGRTLPAACPPSAPEATEAAGRGTPLPADATRGGGPRGGEGDGTRSTNLMAALQAAPALPRSARASRPRPPRYEQTLRAGDTERGGNMPRRGTTSSNRSAAAPRQRTETRDPSSTRTARVAGALVGGRAADARPTGGRWLHVPRRLCPRARAPKGGRVGSPRDPPHGKRPGRTREGRGSGASA